MKVFESDVHGIKYLFGQKYQIFGLFLQEGRFSWLEVG